MIPESTRKRRQKDGEHHGDIDLRPSKRTHLSRPTDAAPRDSASWVFLPEFYDNLPCIYLTRRALEENDRRSRLAYRKQKSTPSRSRDPPAQNIAAFSRHGGPDLTDLRGYLPTTMPRKKVTFSPGTGPAPPPHIPVSAASGSVAASSDSSSSSLAQPGAKSRKSSAYDANFEQHLTEFRIFNTARSTRPSNLAEVAAALRAPRPDDEDGRRIAVTEEEFAALEAAYDRVRDEDDVVADILPYLVGKGDFVEHRPSRNVLFNNMTPLTTNAIVPAKPDMYYGALPEQVAPNVRAALAAHIIPTTAAYDRPLLPNFFVEVKGPGGTETVALRQVRYDGAVGARAMHSLQNYANVRGGVPSAAHVHDGRLRTLSATLFSDRLYVYGHHVAAPEPGESRPSYHMSRLGSWFLIGDIEQFRQAVLAYRNTLDLAKHFRDELIEAANLAAGGAAGVETVGALTPAEPQAAPQAAPPASPGPKRPRDATKSGQVKPLSKRRRPTGSGEAKKTEADKAKKH